MQKQHKLNPSEKSSRAHFSAEAGAADISLAVDMLRLVESAMRAEGEEPDIANAALRCIEEAYTGLGKVVDQLSADISGGYEVLIANERLCETANLINHSKPLRADDPLHDRYHREIEAFFASPCRTLVAYRSKAKIILENPDLFDSLVSWDEGRMMRVFLIAMVEAAANDF
jgi:hypothetical protein